MIADIFLRNFKCFESQSITSRKLTLLTGLNGMGKSTVLQALLVIRQSHTDGLLSKGRLELNGSLVQMGTAQDVLYEGAQSEEFEIGLTWEDGGTAQFVVEYRVESDVLEVKSKSVDHSILEERTPFTDSFHYLAAERIGPRTTNTVSDYSVREHRQLGTLGEYTEHFLYVYGDESVVDERLLHGKSEPNDLHSQVQSWLQEISPGAEVRLVSHPEIDVISLRYSFVTGEERSNNYRATSVGFGITYVLPILVAVLSSSPGSIVLIENPEAHLHPQGQVRMGELLARAAASGIQVIAETHSDHILNGTRLAVHDGVIEPDSVGIHYFSREMNHGRVRTTVDSPMIDKDGRLDHWPAGFFDEWDKSLERLLEPDRK